MTHFAQTQKVQHKPWKKYASVNIGIFSIDFFK